MSERRRTSASVASTSIARSPFSLALRAIARALASYTGFRWLLRITLSVTVLQVLLQWFMAPVLRVIAPTPLYDFSFYYVAALALRENPHVNIYDLSVMPAVANAHHLFLAPGQLAYPLLLPIALIPLTLVSFETASRIWFFFNLLLWVLNAALLVYWLREGLLGSLATAPASRDAALPAPESDARAPLMARLRVGWRELSDASRFALIAGFYVALGYGPLIQAQTLGQSSMLMLTAFLLAPLLVRRGRPELAGALLTLVALIKIFPALLIVYYLVQGRWRVALGAAVSFALLMVGMTAVVGWAGILTMRSLLSAASASVLSTYQNESLARVPMWITIELGGRPGAAGATLGDLLIAGIALAFALGLVWLRWRGQSRVSGEQELLGYCWALCTMILISPVTWEHYDSWLLPAILFSLGVVIRQARGRREIVAGLLILLALVLTFGDLPLGYDGTQTLSLGPAILGHPLRPFFMLLRPLGALLLWSATGLLFLRYRAQAPHPEVADTHRMEGAASAPPSLAVGLLWQRMYATLATFLGALILMRFVVTSVVSIGLAAPR